MQPSYPQFEPGQVVRSVFGEERLVVASQLGCQVFIHGRSDWFHPRKLTLVEKPASEQPACN